MDEKKAPPTSWQRQWEEGSILRCYLLVESFVGKRVPYHDVEDITQEVFVRAFRSSSTYDTERPLCPWLLGIARLVIAAYRRRLRPLSLDCLEMEVMASSSTPSSSVLADEHARSVRRALSVLPGFQALALLEHYVHGKSIAEVAALHGKSQAAVKSALWRGRARASVVFLRQKRPPT